MIIFNIIFAIITIISIIIILCIIVLFYSLTYYSLVISDCLVSIVHRNRPTPAAETFMMRNDLLPKVVTEIYNRDTQYRYNLTLNISTVQKFHYEIESFHFFERKYENSLPREIL